MRYARVLRVLAASTPEMREPGFDRAQGSRHVRRAKSNA